jgi:hypothetical protein
VEIAAALSRHTRQGRDLRLAVIDWFAEAGRNAPGSVPVPEPPGAAVHNAVIWMVATSPFYRLLQLARSARTDSQLDDFYRAAGDALRGASPPPAFDAAAVRHAALTGEDPGRGLLPAAANARGGLIQLIAATGMGIGEVGPDALADGLAASGMFPGIPAGDWVPTLARLEGSEPLGEVGIALGQHAGLAVSFGRYDPLALVKLANAEHLRRARTVLYGLAGMGGLYLMHGFLMPDSPGFAALRARIDELGIGQMLIWMCFGINSTGGFAINLVSCIHPVLWRTHKSLSDQLANGPPLRPPGQSAEEYVAGWLAALKKAASRQEPA